MSSSIIARTFLAAAALCAAAASQPVAAEDAWPVQPITLVVQAAAGGGNDAVARTLAERLQKSLGQPVVVENRAGAGGAIGAEQVSRAKPDGYTLLLLTAGETYYKALNSSVKFDVIKDFVPITLLASAPLVLVANAGLPAKSLAEVVAYAKQKPGELSYGSAGIGSPHQMAGEMFSKAAGIKLVHVPYKGTAPAINDLVAGNLALAWSSPIAVKGFIASGKLRPIAVADSKRIPSMPELPTISESGYPDVKFDNWFGVIAPKATPANVVRRLNDAIMQVGHDPAFAARVGEMGFQLLLQGPREFEARIRQDNERYTRIAQGLGAKGS